MKVRIGVALAQVFFFCSLILAVPLVFSTKFVSRFASSFWSEFSSNKGGES